MKMHFNTLERILFANILPQVVPEQANRFIYKITDDIAKQLSFTKEELEHTEMKSAGQEYDDGLGHKQIVQDGMLVWNQEKEAEIDLDIPDVLADIIINAFEQQDARGELSREAVPIFDKFVEEDKWHKKE